MNKYGENIVLKVNNDKCLAGFYALGFEPKEIMGVLDLLPVPCITR